MDYKNFEPGQYVVYPAHGVGIIQGTEKQNISGAELTVIVIAFEKDKMTVRLPLNNSIKGKIRKLSSKEEMDDAIKCIKSPTRGKKVMWSRRAQEYEAKINSGNPLSIAQVVRDLYRTEIQPDHSYSERKIYEEAFNRFMREYAAVAKIDEKSATEELERALQDAA